MARTTLSPRDAAQTRVTYHHQSMTEPVSYTIAEALATAEDVEVTELELCLADYIAVDALDAMFEQATGSNTSWSLSFTVDAYTVRVDGAGQITVVDD